MSSTDRRLALALEHPSNTPQRILTDVLGVSVRGTRCAAWWRGSTDENVFVGDRAITDHVHGETHSVWRILTELEGWSEEEVQRVLLERAGIVEGSGPVPLQRARRVRRARQAPMQRAPAALKQWQRLPKTGHNTYLERKGVEGSACGAIRYGRGYISLVMYRVTPDERLEPVTVQTIQDDGRKRFAKGGSTKGVCTLVGASTLAEALAQGHVWIAEGIATALTIHAATGAPVLCVFTAGNIELVVTTLRKLRAKSKLAISIAADDDRYKPETGNAGLEKAHHAALSHNCRVVSPTFADRQSQPTDFNDLQILEGLGEVKRQLQDTSLPDPALAYAAEVRRAARAAGPQQERYIPRFELADGVTFVRSPQGTGKTEAQRPLIDRLLKQGKRILYLTHRVTLTDDAARRLGLDVYSDEALKRDIHLAPALACCVNSLHRLMNGEGKLQAFDVVILDESEQFVRALRGKHIANKRRNLEALEFVLRRAQKLVCLDADLGPLTGVLMAQVRPHETWHRLSHHYQVGQGRTMRVHEKRDGVYGALSRLTEPVMVVTNSKTEAEAMGAFLASLGKCGRVLTAERDADDALLMADLDARTQDLDYLVCSPTVSTGVSLIEGHFKHVAGIFYGTVGTPHDALQALWRVRTPVGYDLWLDPRTVHHGIDLNAKYGATKAHEAAMLGREVGHTSQVYRVLAEASERFEQQAQAHYRLGFLKLAALQGFDFQRVEDSEADRDLAKDARALAGELYRARIRDARVLEPREAEALSTGRLHSRDDRDALERFHITSFYRLDSSNDITDALDVDHRGRYRRQLLRLERVLEDETRTNMAIDELAARREMNADLPPLFSLKQFNRKMLQALDSTNAMRSVLAGDVCQLDMPRYDSESLEGLRRWIERNRSWLAGLVVLPDPAKLKANIIRYVGTWLKTLGLKQKRVGKHDAQTYALEVESLKLACMTMERRGTLFLEERVSRKSVPSVLASPTKLLESLRAVVQRAGDSLNRKRLLEAFARADTGDKYAVEALRAYAQQPEVSALVLTGGAA